MVSLHSDQFKFEFCDTDRLTDRQSDTETAHIFEPHSRFAWARQRERERAGASLHGQQRTRRGKRRAGRRPPWLPWPQLLAPREAPCPSCKARRDTASLPAASDRMYGNFPGGWGGGYVNSTNVTAPAPVVSRPAPPGRQSSMRVGTSEQAADAGHAIYSPKSGKPFNPANQSRVING